MFSTRFSRSTNPNVMRMFAILRERKGLEKIPNKTIEYYIDDKTNHARRTYVKFPPKPSKEAMDRL